MNDLISRQAAIKELGEMATALYGYDAASVISCAIYKLQNLPAKQRCEYWDNESGFCALNKPSAQQERKTGKWIKLYAGNYKCSVCGDWWGNDDNEMVEDFKYCPNCGAFMQKEGDRNE